MSGVPPSPEQLAAMNANARPVEFQEIGDALPEIRVRIDDDGKEAVLRVRFAIQSVARLGNDPNNGLPAYGVQTTVILGLLKVDPRLKKQGVFPVARPGDASVGVR